MPAGVSGAGFLVRAEQEFLQIAVSENLSGACQFDFNRLKVLAVGTVGGVGGFVGFRVKQAADFAQHIFVGRRTRLLHLAGAFPGCHPQLIFLE